jgi:hypothetical protein
MYFGVKICHKCDQSTYISTRILMAQELQIRHANLMYEQFNNAGKVLKRLSFSRIRVNVKIKHLGESLSARVFCIGTDIRNRTISAASHS